MNAEEYFSNYLKVITDIITNVKFMNNRKLPYDSNYDKNFDFIY